METLLLPLLYQVKAQVGTIHVHNIRIEVGSSIKHPFTNQIQRTNMSSYNDPHVFSAANKIVRRLRLEIHQRQEWRKSFPSHGEYQVYTIVRDAEAWFTTDLQSSEENEDDILRLCRKYDTARTDPWAEVSPQPPSMPTRTTFWGKMRSSAFGAVSGAFAPVSDDQVFKNEALDRIIRGQTLDDMDWDGPGSLEQHQQKIADTFWLHVESAFSLYAQLRAAMDWQGIYHAVAQYTRVVTGKPIGVTIMKVYERVKELITDIMQVASDLQSDEDFNPFARFRHWLSMCETVATHPVVVKIKKIFYYLMSFSLLERFGVTFNTFWYSKAEAELIKSQHNSQTGFFAAVIEGTSYLLERLYDCYRTGSWNAIIHSGRTYGAWVDEVYALKELAQMLHNPEATGVSYHEYLGRLGSCIEQGESICKFADGLSTAERTLIKRLLSDVRLLNASELTKKAARQSRQTPFTLLWYAGSSVGKSTLEDLTFSHFAKVHDLPPDPEYHYTRCFADPYWSGFQTYMWSIALDDIASKNPNAGLGDLSMEEILIIINQVPNTPPQADLPDKGKTPLRPLLVQGTTNTKHLNASSYYCNQLAILRRFPMVITVIVKEEYCKLVNGKVPNEANRMLDTSRCPVLAQGEYPDYWEFIVEKVVAHTDPTSGVQYAKYQDYFPGGERITSIYAFLAMVSRESKIHREHQDQVSASADAYKAVEVCRVCYLPMVRCTCEQEIQSEEIAGLHPATWVVLAGLVYQLYLSVFQPWYTALKKQCQIAVEEYLKARLKRAAYKAVLGSNERIVDVAEAATHMASKFSRDLDSIRARVACSAISATEKLRCEGAEVKAVLVAAGDRVRKHVIKHKALYAFLSFVPTAVAMAAAWKMWNTPFVQTSAEEGGRPEARDEKPNPWYRDDYEPTTFDVGALSASWKALTMEQVGKKVYRNCLYAKATYTRGEELMSRNMRLFGLGGNLYVTNNHNIPELDVTLDVVMQQKTAGISTNFKFFLGVKDTFRLPEADLVFFRIGCAPPLPNLLDLLPGATFRTVCPGVLCGRNENGADEVHALQGIRFEEGKYTPALERNFNVWHTTVDRDTEKGMCGSVVLGFTPSGPMLLGLHQTGGLNKRTAAVQLTREHADAAIAHFHTSIVQAGSPDLTDKFGVPMVVQPLHHKSVFRFMEKGVANVYGSLPGFRATHRSKVTKTIIADACVDRGYEIKTAPPAMRGWEPWRHAATDIVDQQFTVRQSLLDECVDAFAADILGSLGADQLGELQVLDNATTLNGYPGTKFIDKMNRRTSMGFPYREKKLHYLKNKGKVDVWEDYVEFHDGFYDRVDGIIERYENGVRYMPVFTGHLKDEPLKQSKVDAKKTRVFSGGPAEWCFVVRKYLLSLVRVMQNNKYVFETAPGTNATSAEWDQMYHYLTAHGPDRIVAGDYTKFDKKMSAQWILAAFKVIDKVLEAAGWGERERLIVQCIGYDTAFPLTDFNGDLVEFWGSNPSGHPLTVIINGLVNSLYCRYAWAMEGNFLSRFKTLVNLMTYGDDNIMGVSRDVANFDHTVLVRNLATLGVTYTMADKEAESVPFVNIADVTFLKRGWRLDPEVGHHVAQLEHDSISKMLTMHLPSKVVCSEQHGVDIMFTALAEYFFYGRETFNDRREMFLSIIEELGLAAYYHREFPTYDEILAVYRSNSEDVYPGGRCGLCC